MRPDLVAISGDLTQRARRREFQKARAFLDRLQAPVLVVPGNHDIPLYDVVRRFVQPLHRYKKYITKDLTPWHEDDGMAVLGLNSARSRTFKDGRLSLIQMALIRKRFRKVPDEAHRAVVMHHPLIPPKSAPKATLLGRAPLALRAMRAAGVNLLLAGHFHQGFSGDVRNHHRRFRRSIVVAQAGTAISSRRRGEPNAYNAIRLRRDRITLQVQAWNRQRFVAGLTTRYRREDGEWLRLDD
jgi:3',5'-cyclic AMP phosphodiesterase CpdA